ncbi:MAG TPA: Panacea domain-containing protein, partial [Vicinamibacterales bacterium]|nr:Panacea domain-containing protein [Vicinamibacterales bacterium]
MRQFTEDRRRLKELILYISQESASDPDYGWTALNKILFFSDFLAYAKFGKPITGTEYMREKHGPVPRPLRAGKQSPVQELTRAGDLRLDAKPLKEQLP